MEIFNLNPKSLMENFIFCAVYVADSVFCVLVSLLFMNRVQKKKIF